MRKFVNEKIDLSDDVVITHENVKTLGEKIALCATKNARRFAYGEIDILYAKLQHDIFHKNTFSDGYDIAQEAICFLCSYIGHKLGEVCVPNIHKKLDNIRMGCFKHIYTYLRKERKVIEQENIENCIIKVDEDCLKTPEDYTRVRKIIKQLNLTPNELKTLLCFYNQMTYTNITEFLHIDRRTVARRKKEIYKNETGTKKERTEKVIEEINKEIKNKEKSVEIVNNVLEKEKRNKTVRLTRLLRKARLQEWTHFCTFTYDSNKLTEEEFRKKLLTCLRHLAHRKNWKYIGVFERSPVEKRLHFHGIFVIPQMLGEIVETKDYSTKNHQMQVAYQNTFFLERFGRNDFRPIDKNGIDDSIKYLTKYIGKDDEKIIYSKHLQTYFVTDILEEDVVCTIGQEDRKILLYDDFKCMAFDTGEILGQVSKDKELINRLPKAY